MLIKIAPPACSDSVFGVTTRVTLRDVANATGFHFTTVGLALRSDPRVRPETVEKVRAAAKQLGYRPDPMLAALSSYRHTQRHVFRGTIGFLLPHDYRTMMNYNGGTRTAYEAAMAYADELGFKIEPIDAFAPGMNTGRLTQLLEARGICGLILTPLLEPGEYPPFPWERFSAVAIGYSVVAPALHRTSVHQARAMRILLGELRAMGYQRIGLVIGHGANLRTDHNFLGAYLADQELKGPRRPLRPLFMDEPFSRPKLERWLAAEKPDCVVSGSRQMIAQLRLLGRRVPEDIGFALLGLWPAMVDVAGIDENWAGVGRAAVDLVVALMKNQETGVPAFPRFALVEARWVPGPTVRPQ